MVTEIPFARPVIGDEEKQEIISCLESGWLTRGPRTTQFESDLGSYLQVPYITGVNSGTSALHLALASHNIGENDEVLTTPLTWPATTNSILYERATPVFVDINAETLNVNLELLQERISPKTKAILPVHMYGNPCNLELLRKISDENDLILIQDAAHCIEGEYRNKNLATYGDVSCYSFYANKNMTTGEGGAIASLNPDIAEKIKILSTSGIGIQSWSKHSHDLSSKRIAVDLGYKYNMFDLQASLGIHQLKKLDDFYNQRKNLWKIYKDMFYENEFFKIPEIDKNSKHAFHIFAIILNSESIRDKTMINLKKEGISTGIHYHSLSVQDFYSKYFTKNTTPIANDLTFRLLSLPFSHGHSEEEIITVGETLLKILRNIN